MRARRGRRGPGACQGVRRVSEVQPRLGCIVGGMRSTLPVFCRVAGSIAPTPDSDIRFEVWMPLANWNGKFAGVGNGGWAGVISYGPLAQQLRRGYAAASTNTGPEAAPGLDMARFAYDKPERLIDFAYRSH